MLTDHFALKPDFINEKAKFWIDHDSIDYAKSLNLKNIDIFFVEFLDTNERTRLISRDSKPLYENTSLESLLIWLDIMALNENKSK